METTTVFSSHGIIEIYSQTGNVIEIETVCSDDCERCIREITRFNIAEWKQYYNVPIPGRIDILDIGYWSEVDGRTIYSRPEPDYRGGRHTAEHRYNSIGSISFLIYHDEEEPTYEEIEKALQMELGAAYTQLSFDFEEIRVTDTIDNYNYNRNRLQWKIPQPPK